MPDALFPPAAARAPAWRIATFTAVAMTATVFGQTSGVSVFVDPVAGGLGLTRPEISGVYSAATLVAALFMPRMGRQIDRHGVRRATLAIALAFGLVIIGLALAPGIAWLALGFFGIRLLGQGALSLAARTILAVRFSSTLGRAVGISGVFAAIGMSMAPLILTAAIDAIDWRATWVLAGLSVWIVFVPLALWLLRSGEDRPVSLPDGSEAAGRPDWTRQQALRTPMFWLVSLVGGSVSMIITGLTFHQISVLGEAGLSPVQAAANFVPQTIAGVAAIGLVGPLSDRLSARVLLMVTMGLLAAAILMLPLVSQPWIPVVYGLALGGAVGSSQALEGTLYPRFFGVGAIGAIRGTAFTIGIAGAALGPVVIGLIREVSGSYVAVTPLLVGIPIGLAVAAFLVPRPTLPPARALPLDTAAGAS